MNKFVSLTDNDDEQKIYTETDNITIIVGAIINEGINKRLKLLLKKYQESFQAIKSSYNVFDSIEKFYYKFHKISLTKRGSYIPTLKWIKNKKATVNVQNDDNKSFQYSIINALYYNDIITKHQKVTNVRP